MKIILWVVFLLYVYMVYRSIVTVMVTERGKLLRKINRRRVFMLYTALLFFHTFYQMFKNKGEWTDWLGFCMVVSVICLFLNHIAQRRLNENAAILEFIHEEARVYRRTNGVLGARRNFRRK